MAERERKPFIKEASSEEARPPPETKGHRVRYCFRLPVTAGEAAGTERLPTPPPPDTRPALPQSRPPLGWHLSPCYFPGPKPAPGKWARLRRKAEACVILQQGIQTQGRHWEQGQGRGLELRHQRNGHLGHESDGNHWPERT